MTRRNRSTAPRVGTLFALVATCAIACSTQSADTQRDAEDAAAGNVSTTDSTSEVDATTSAQGAEAETSAVAPNSEVGGGAEAGSSAGGGLAFVDAGTDPRAPQPEGSDAGRSEPDASSDCTGCPVVELPNAQHDAATAPTRELASDPDGSVTDDALGVDGRWGCAADDIGASSCSDAAPWDPERGAVCLAGTTSDAVDAWGASLELSFADGAAGSTGFDAVQARVVGFRLSLTGDSGGLPLRIGFRSHAQQTVLPFVEVPGAGNYEVLFEDARVPDAWDVDCSDARCVVDPVSILSMQILVVGGTAASYDLCVSKLEALPGDPPRPETVASEADPDPIEVDTPEAPPPAATLLVPLSDLGFAGAWSCEHDDLGEHACVTEDDRAEVACVSGSNSLDEQAWGAWLGRSFSDANEPVDMSALGVVGFRIGVTGSTGRNPLRVGYASGASTLADPFVALPEPGSYDVFFADARVPEAWNACSGDACLVDPSRVQSIWLQIVPEETGDYELCVTDLFALLEE